VIYCDNIGFRLVLVRRGLQQEAFSADLDISRDQTRACVDFVATVLLVRALWLLVSRVRTSAMGLLFLVFITCRAANGAVRL
jgi:hypothetical protein